MQDVTLQVNGATYDIQVEPRRLLADALREECGLTGTHIGCNSGACGACTVLLDGAPIRACLIFAVQAEGHTLRTVEGLATGDTLHPAQEAFARHHGLQCGYCTPGFLMLAAWLMERGEPMDDQALRETVSANLCRCTGYAGIMRAMRSLVPSPATSPK